ncbi:TPA: helix-turn-helix domain-containing protein, partial [Escherichia coli]|nr:helix-turn-helix domain-containing protein [Escherichia coli]
TKGCLIANFATVPIKFGRRRTVDRNVVLTLHQKGTGATEIAHQLSIARSTVYKILEDERAS